MKKTSSYGFRSRYDPERSWVKEKSGTKVARPGRHPRIMPPVLMVALLLVTAVTIMYLVALSDMKTNTFTIGTAGVEIVETTSTSSDGGISWGEDTKIVSLQNTELETNISGVVRVMLVPVLKNDEGEVLSGSLGSIEESPAGTTLELGDITLHFASNWNSNWFYQDGYFYYREVLDPGDTTEALLTGVTLTKSSTVSDLFEEDTTGYITIEVLADILQTEGDALDEWGVKVEGTTVTPK